MFEKEAEERARKFAETQVLDDYNGGQELKCTDYNCGEVAGYEKGFVDGAEFGYNKANEWHFVKDELPELYKDVLVVFPRGDCDVKRLTNHNEWVGRGSWCSLTDVIAWKEIVLPELPKESE